MNIVFVSDSIYPFNKGGKEKRLYEISTRLVKLGHNVHIYTMHWWEDQNKTKTVDGIKLHAISKKINLYNNDRRSIKEGVFFGFACLKLFKSDFDILDVDHMPFFPIITTWVICKLKRKKLYGTWHEVLTVREWINYMGIGGLVASVLEHICIRLPNTITAASKQTQELLLDRRKERNNVYLVTNGVNFKLINDTKPFAQEFDILTVCRLVKDKNVNKLIDSIALLAKRNKKISCVIVGEGPQKSTLIKYVKKLKLEINIKFINKLPKSNDVYSYMKAAKVFCLPSTREGFGIVILEAISCGTPVVTTSSKFNYSRKLITNHENGSLASLDPVSIAHELDYWISKNQKNSVSKKYYKYDWDILAKNQAMVYSL